jgi:hypothetical protein
VRVSNSSQGNYDRLTLIKIPTGMDDLSWLIALHPAGREAVGFTDYDFMPTPRLASDDAYMKGWNEAHKMATKMQLHRSSTVSSSQLLKLSQ